jgi:type I restriction enzyme, R subunit
MENKNPEQYARDRIDRQLQAAGWVLQPFKTMNPHQALGVAVTEYLTATGPADYILFVDGDPVGVIEAKREDLAFKISTVEEQTSRYAKSILKGFTKPVNLPFIYESTGTVCRFTDSRDPQPRSRGIFHFHEPHTLHQYIKEGRALRDRLQDLPTLEVENLRECQEIAITNLENSFRNGRPRALIQMATGAGKTYTAITSVYRLLKIAKAKRVLFLVDTTNLGKQAEQEFAAYIPYDENRKFSELYSVRRLQSNYISKDDQVYISTIQRMYSILRGKNLVACPFNIY